MGSNPSHANNVLYYFHKSVTFLWGKNSKCTSLIMNGFYHIWFCMEIYENLKLILPELCEGECEGDCIEMTGWVNVIPWALGISLTLIWPSDVAFRVEGCKGLAFEELVVDGLKKDIKKLKIEKIYLEYIHKMILDQDIIQKY